MNSQYGEGTGTALINLGVIAEGGGSPAPETSQTSGSPPQPASTTEPTEERHRESRPPVGPLRRYLRWFGAPLPWAGTQPFRRFVQASLLVVVAILLFKFLTNADTRLEVYLVDVAVVFVLGFVILEGDRARKLHSAASVGSLTIAIAAVVLDVALNLGAGAVLGYQASPNPGFADAILLILALFLSFYGWRSVRPMAAPISLLILLAVITQFISNSNPVFVEYVGRYFIQLMVWTGSGILTLMGFSVVTGPDSFTVIGSASVNVAIGIRCAGLDVAVLYALLIGYFAWSTTLSTKRRLLIAILAGLGTLGVNALRIVGLTILFLNYPPQLVEAIHTNIGDLIFLLYAMPFILFLRRYRSA